MNGIATRTKALVTRIAGLRRSGHGIGERMDAMQDDVASRLDALLAEVAILDQRVEERIARLDDLLSRQGGTATERDETIQNQLSELGDRMEAALGKAYRHGAAQVAGEVRADILLLRADLAREAEERDERISKTEASP